MKSSKLLLTSLLAAAALSVPAYAEVTPIDTETYNSGADAVTVSGSVDTLNVAGAGNVTVAGDLAPKTEGGAVAVVLKNSGGLTFSLAEGETAETGRSYTVGTISTETDTGKNTRFLTVDAGVTVNATSLNNAWGMNALTVNGVLNVSGTFTFATGGGCANAVSGTGTISAGTFDFANVGSYTLTDVTLNVGTGGIVHKNTNSHTLNLGNVSIVASVGDFTFASSSGETAKLTDASTGTTFDTNGHVITVNQALSGTGKLKKVGEGTLKISGNNTYSGGTLIEAGTLELTSTGSLTGNVEVAGGSFTVAGTLNLSSAVTVAGAASVSVSNTAVFVLLDSLKISETGNTYSLISGGTINGWNAETLSVTNFRRSDGKYLSGRSTIDFSSAGSVTITGEAYNLFWKSGVTAWNSDTEFDKDSAGSGTTSRFETCDNVTFATTGAVEVSVASTGVTAGTVKITAGTVTLSDGKVTAQDGFFVGDGVSEDDSTAKLVLSSNNALCGDVTVNKGGTFDLNAQSDSMSSDATNPNRVGKIVLNGGSLTSTGGNQDANSCQIYNLEVTADSKIIGEGIFGILGRGHNPTTLDLGANTLTKSGSGSFVLVRTTISGNGGVLDVTEGKILGHGSYALTLGEGVTLKTSGTGGAQDVKIASMGANSKLILGGSTASTVALNSFALGTEAVIDVSGANAVTGTITSVGANAQLTLAGTGASAVTLSGNIGANANVSVASGSSLTGTNGTTISVGAGSTLSSAGTVSMHRLTLSNTSSATVTGGTFTVSNEEEGLYVCGGATFTVEGGVATVGRLVLNSAGSPPKTDSASANVSVTGGVLNVTRATQHGVVLGSYESDLPQVISVSGDGVFNANCAITMQYAAAGQINVSGNGEMNVKGLAFGIDGKTTAGTVNVTGGRLNIGSSGITQAGSGPKTVSFSDATIGALDSWSGASAITLGGTVIFDTTKMVASTTGKSSADATDTAGTTIELSGKISGSGTLKKIGAGTLKLSGANDFTGNIEIAEGVVVTTRPYSLGNAAVTVKLSGGQLQVNASTNGAIVQTAISIVLSDAYSSTAAITGAGALAADTTITIEDLALDTVAEAALQNQYSFQIATADTTIASSLTAGSFMFSEALRSDWRVSAYTNGVLTIAAIPEPSAFGLLAGLGALALAGTRRRRKKA